MPEPRLRKLELTGFKTFARRTELILPGGVTGIVGPNGSGKSNLADALRWVLGEQSLQHIRGKKTEDVIFAGGASRAPMGAAEVFLTLDNVEGWIPLDFSEVTISRRAYRSGDNEYFINGARVRLRDVSELRNRAGFGQSSYSVIGQGLVDAVLSQRPEERRALFEEAAGIRHYQAKRDQTLDQLAAAQQNLVRVQDIVAEIEPRLESLRRQSEKARQHAELGEDLRRLQIHWYAARQRQLQRQAAEAQTALGEAQRALEASAEELRSREATLAELQTEQAATDQALARESQREADLSRRLEQLRGQADLAADKLRFMRQQGQDADREVVDLADAHGKLAAQRQQLAATIEDLERGAHEAAKKLETAGQAANSRGAAAREAEQSLDAARDELAAAAAALDQRRRESAQLDDRARELQQQAQQHQEDIGRKQGLSQALNEKLASLQTEIQQLRAEEERLSGEAEGLRLDAQAAAAALAEHQAELQRLTASRDELATRLRLLGELQTNLEGLAEGARELIRASRPGVLGSLAEGLKTKPGYERAIATALGHKLDAVLVDGTAAALEILRDGTVRDATLLPADEPCHAERRAKHPPGRSSRLGNPPLAAEFLTAGHPALLRVLADVVVVEHLEEALSAAQAGWRAVTPLGDLVEPDGTIIRRGVSAGEAILKRQRALDELASEAEAAEQEVTRAEGEAQRLAAESAALAQQLGAVEEEVRRRASARQQRAGHMRDLAQQVQAAQAQIDWLAALKEQLQEQLNAIQNRRTTLIAELDQAAERIPELEADVQRRQTDAAGLRQAGEAEAARLSELRLHQEVARQQLRNAQAQLAELDQRLLHAERHLAARQQRSREHAATVAQLQAEIDRTTTDLEGLSQALQGQQAALAPLRERRAAVATQLTELRASEAEARERQAELDKRCYRLSFDSQCKSDELEALAVGLLDELQLTPDLLPEPAPGAPEPSKREIEVLKVRLAGLGPINPGALE
ncbi:MAG TPA: chromosome segregation protein SMC, partial [Chloroflexota bacterium]